MSPWIPQLHEAHPLNFFCLKKWIPVGDTNQQVNKNRISKASAKGQALIIPYQWKKLRPKKACWANPGACFANMFVRQGPPRMLGHDARKTVIASLIHLRGHEEIGIVVSGEQFPNCSRSDTKSLTRMHAQALLHKTGIALSKIQSPLL